MIEKSVPWQGEFHEITVYQPSERPGFVAWVNAFSFGNGETGLAFDQVLRKKDPRFVPPRLEFGEAVGAPVSYGSVECGEEGLSAFRVYMRSADGVHFTETGRCPRTEGSFCHAGFPDGRILGFDVPRRNEKGDGWADHIRVSESIDGGSTWHVVRRLLEGNAPYLWRVRTLKNGEILLLASFYGTPWGPEKDRPTRNTMLPGETYINKIQTFFLTSPDGVHFSPPQYILPGIGAHEYDAVETDENTLLFIAGDVQGTPVGRQFVRRTPDGWINGPLLSIGRGAPEDPKENPQGGFVPETLIQEERTGTLVGFRRGKGYALSADQGENWTAIDMPGMRELPYQPVMLALPDGRIALYGHLGGDNAFGEKDMKMIAHVLSLSPDAHLPKCGTLTMEREKDREDKKYLNAFRVKLQGGDRPMSGKTVIFRFQAFWKKDGSVNTLPQKEAAFQVPSVTDENGIARAEAPWFDHRADIHLAYNADAIFEGDAECAPCSGPMMTVLALTPERHNPYPYDAYFAGGVLYLSPLLVKDLPDLPEILTAQVGDSPLLEDGLLPPEAVLRLERSGVLEKDGEQWLWIPSVHAPRPLHDVKIMSAGDQYI